jgi:hypothetical protein
LVLLYFGDLLNNIFENYFWELFKAENRYTIKSGALQISIIHIKWW